MGATLAIPETHQENGQRVWDGCVYLCRAFERMSLACGAPLPPRQRILELGAGCALASMVLAHLSPTARILATDTPSVCTHMARCLARNRVRAVDVAPLVWNTSEHVAAAAAWSAGALGGAGAAAAGFDLVVASDMAAPVASAQDFVETVAALLAPAPARAAQPPPRSPLGADDEQSAATATPAPSPSPRSSLADFLRLPGLVLCAQSHRELTPALLGALERRFGSEAVVRVPDEALPLTSPRHAIYTVAATAATAGDTRALAGSGAASS